MADRQVTGCAGSVLQPGSGAEGAQPAMYPIRIEGFVSPLLRGDPAGELSRAHVKGWEQTCYLWNGGKRGRKMRGASSTSGG